ncbi:hypothetical protein LTR78_009268 [Recurvomyces mirabilis]|uniref:Uncharacterized protein n=1 Tax=Recurvomyces mirabilis TaxID=574656 RepID=A0AAE0WGK8_9PEZI|nr:hypothetical protein LTR78_009268 [Recurvomyces mirabilis]KAK5156171.1 hypothetical protein LTS14_005058 [Recurvomyces mirabilis]
MFSAEGRTMLYRAALAAASTQWVLRRREVPGRRGVASAGRDSGEAEVAIALGALTEEGDVLVTLEDEREAAAAVASNAD